MAFYRRRRGRCVTVYYYDRTEQKLVQLPRKKTRHLDSLNDEEVDSWIENWERESGITVDRTLRKRHLLSEELESLWQGYQAAHKARRPTLAKGTIRTLDTRFRKYIVGYFIEKHGLKDVRQWSQHIADFPSYLAQYPLITGTPDVSLQKSVLWLLMKFSQYLERRGKISRAWTFDMPARTNPEETPLRKYLQPDEALTAARKLNTDGMRPWSLAILAGYFGCLSPSEVFGLRNEDFITGSEIPNLCSTYEGLRKYGLGSKMAISVERTLASDSGTEEKYGKVKNKYRKDYANIWLIEAARILSDILRELPSGPIFNYTRGHLDKLYRKIVYPLVQVTQHDLRRASCAYLGDESGINLELKLLRKIMRHSVITTTLRYTRRPTRELRKPASPRNLDDIA